MERRHPRFDTDGLLGRLGFSADARVRNLSLAGMGIETSIALQPGQTYSIQLGQGLDQLTIAGTVRWSTLCGTRRTASGEQEPLYDAGVELEGVLSQVGHGVVQFLERFAVLEPGERLFGRLGTERDSTARVGREAEVQVRQISRAGVLVESSMRLTAESRGELEIELGGNEFSSPVRVVHIRPMGPGGETRFLIGMELIDTEPSQRGLLEQFIRDEVGKRLWPSDQTRTAAQTPAASAVPIPPLRYDNAHELAAGDSEEPYRGNPRSRVFHRRGCRHYDGLGGGPSFGSRDEAVAAGFRPAKDCEA